VYGALALAGIWIAVGSLLIYRRDGDRRLLYLGFFTAGAMLMLLYEILCVYCAVNVILAAPGVLLTARSVYVVGELLQFFAVPALALAVARIRPPRAVLVIYVLLLAAYAVAEALLIALNSAFELTHLALGAAHLIAVVIVLRYRARILNPRVRATALQVVAVAAVFAPLIGASVYSGFADDFVFGSMTFQIGYLLLLEIVIGAHAVRDYFAPVRVTAEALAGAPHGNGNGQGNGASGAAGGVAAVAPGTAAPPAAAGDPRLSLREREIAALVANGYTNNEIGTILSISGKTVTNHLYHMYRKLEVKNRVELIAELRGPHPHQ
jgi:DNA-binding CsgD family transcriptional regulator